MLVLDKSGKILYTNKKGVKIINNRFSPTYKGNKNKLGNIYDLIHNSSKELVNEILSPNYECDNFDK